MSAIPSSVFRAGPSYSSISTAQVRTVADWNPVSAATSAARELFGNPNPSAASAAWPMRHPVLAAVLWSLALIAVFAPLAAAFYRRSTTD
jgi:hypothetical protein